MEKEEIRVWLRNMQKIVYFCYYDDKSRPTQEPEASGDSVFETVSQYSNEVNLSSDNSQGINVEKLYWGTNRK